MSEWSPSRRTVLQTGGAVGAAALAGCLPDASDGDTGGPATDEPGPESPLDLVPAGSQLVLHADVATLLNDEQLRTRLNDLLGAAGDSAPMGATDVQSALDAIESTASLDPRALRRVTAFGGYDADTAAGLRIEAGWEESSLRDAMGGGIEPETQTYNDRTVYRYGEDTALGVLKNGTYVLGTTAGVEGTIDVATGDADPASGQIREAFTAAPRGPLRFAFDVPADLGGEANGDGPVDVSSFAALTHGYGGYVIDGDARSAALTLETDPSDDATTVADELRAARQLALDNIDEATDGTELTADLREMLNSLEILTDGSAVTATTTEAALLLVSLVAVVPTFLLGFGSQQEVSPRARFSFDYDSAGELTITHTAGDTIPASQLAIRGEGIGATGTWSELGGSASGALEGQPAVVAGDSVTVPAEADYVVRVVWQSADGSTSSTLAANRGPDA